MHFLAASLLNPHRQTLFFFFPPKFLFGKIRPSGGLEYSPGSSMAGKALKYISSHVMYWYITGVSEYKIPNRFITISTCFSNNLIDPYISVIVFRRLVVCRICNK